jgi:hypothetical protein
MPMKLNPPATLPPGHFNCADQTDDAAIDSLLKQLSMNHQMNHQPYLAAEPFTTQVMQAVAHDAAALAQRRKWRQYILLGSAPLGVIAAFAGLGGDGLSRVWQAFTDLSAGGVGLGALIIVGACVAAPLRWSHCSHCQYPRLRSVVL